jgi:pimeloyl-ACP methyl ester carboxylesterase
MPFVERDGLRFFYEREGSGTTELVFVPGWCCDGSAFAPQFEHFKTSCTVTTIDLRGCGQTSRPDDGYDIPSLADDVAHVCGELGIERAVFVGHSLGGMIGVELGARWPSLTRAVVCVDPGPISFTDESRATFDAFAAAMAGPDGDRARRAYVESIPGPTVDDALSGRIVEMMCAVPLPVARAVVERLTSWNGAGALALCDMPVLVLRSYASPRDEPTRLRQLKADVELGVTVGAGHFHQLEVPEQVNAMIERFLALRLSAQH